MRTILICNLSFVLMLSVYGCFGSRDRGDKIDSGFDGADVVIETGGTSGGDAPIAGSGGIDGGRAGVAGGGVNPFDAAVIDVLVVQAGTNGFGGTGGISGTGGIDIDDDAGIDIDDDAGTSDAPCDPNCPSLEWVTIPGGTFTMGSVEGIGADTERPQHEVTVQTFRMSKTEVTVAQYRVCFSMNICSAPLDGNDLHNWGWSGRENYPVNSVDWHQAREFAEWLGGRLPSEAEWEYAARSGGRDIVFPWGNEDATCEFAVMGVDASQNFCGYETTMEVCSKPLGNTIQGLCDMAGNVWEWVEDDWHNSYSGAPLDGQAWIDSTRSNLRVLRGGQWDVNQVFCRCAHRHRGYPDVRDLNYGFRIVLDLQ